MSNVTNLILSFSIVESDSKIDQINTWVKLQYNADFGSDICNWDNYGGNKVLETPLYVAAFNYFNTNEFMNFLKSIEWKYPNDVQVFVQLQNSDRFSVRDLENE